MRTLSGDLGTAKEKRPKSITLESRRSQGSCVDQPCSPRWTPPEVEHLAEKDRVYLHLPVDDDLWGTALMIKIDDERVVGWTEDFDLTTHMELPKIREYL